MEQFALMVKLKVPDREGVPASVAAFELPVKLRLRPGGTGPLVANAQALPFTTLRFCEYAIPSAAEESDAGLKLRPGAGTSSLRMIPIAVRIGVIGDAPEIPERTTLKFSSGSTVVSPFT